MKKNDIEKIRIKKMKECRNTSMTRLQKYLRIIRGITEISLSDISENTGISRQTLYRIESHKANMSYYHYVALRTFFEKTFEIQLEYGVEQENIEIILGTTILSILFKIILNDNNILNSKEYYYIEKWCDDYSKQFDELNLKNAEKLTLSYDEISNYISKIFTEENLGIKWILALFKDILEFNKNFNKVENSPLSLYNFWDTTNEPIYIKLIFYAISLLISCYLLILYSDGTDEYYAEALSELDKLNYEEYNNFLEDTTNNSSEFTNNMLNMIFSPKYLEEFFYQVKEKSKWYYPSSSYSIKFADLLYNNTTYNSSYYFIKDISDSVFVVVEEEDEEDLLKQGVIGRSILMLTRILKKSVRYDEYSGSREPRFR